MSKENYFEYPIDLVYLWVDGDDTKWKEKKSFYQSKEKNLDIQAYCKGRFINNDELKYSLRSVEKYIPWVNNIFIVTDEQVPRWLNINHPKIKMIFHKDFIPNEILPLFNSCAIECFLADIPNLSEHFIYANDDMFINFPLEKSFFFNEKGYPIARVKKSNKNKIIETSMYSRRIFRMLDKIKEKFNKNICYTPHHNIDSYLKSDFIKCREFFKEEFEQTSKNKFRKEEDVERFIINLYQGSVSCGNFKEVHKIDVDLNIFQKITNRLLNKLQVDSKVVNIMNPDFSSEFFKLKPKLFCINDGENVTEEGRRQAREFLEKLLKDKSSFEI